MAPHAANKVQEVALFLANSIRVVPYINPKHKGEWQTKLEKYQIKVKTNRLRVKESIKGRNNSNLGRSGSFTPKYTESDNRFDWR